MYFGQIGLCLGFGGLLAWAWSWITGRRGQQRSGNCESKEMRCPGGLKITGLQVRYSRVEIGDRDYYDFGGESKSAHAHMTRRAWVPPSFAKHDATGERRVRRRFTGAEATDLLEVREVMGRVADGLVQRDEMSTAAEQHVGVGSAL